MPGKRSPGPSVKDKKLYEKLRDQGYSKEKSARIANARANPSMHPSEKGGHARKYEDQTKDQLYQRAKQIGIPGRSDMTKRELIDALRHH